MATYYWVGGAGTWDNASTANWAASSNGASGAGPPTASDTATFDSSSGTGTCTIAATAACATLNFGAANITTSFSGNVTFGAVVVTAGTFVTGANTHSFTSLTSTTGTRTLTLTNSTINITGTSGTPWNVTTGGTLTFTNTGSTINLSGGAASVALTIAQSGTLSWATLNITGPGNWNFSSSTTSTFNVLTYTSTTNKTDSLSSVSNITIAAAGTLTLAGNSSVNRAFLKSTTLGTTRSISVPSGATVTVTNVDFQDINMTGTFSTGATASSIGDALGNTFGWSSVQPDASSPQTLTGTGTINWSDAVWSGRVPLPQDDVDLGSSSTATTLTADMPRLGRNITATNYNKTLSFASTPNTIFGNIALGASGTLSGTQALTLAGRGAQTITSATKQFPQLINISSFGGSYTLQDNFNCVGSFSVTDGTYNGGAFDLAASSFRSTSGFTRTTNLGSGTYSLSGVGITAFNILAAAGTMNAGTAIIKFTGANPTSVIFAGAGLTYGTLWWSSTTSTGTLIITGANTFAALRMDCTLARTLQLPASTINAIGSFTQDNRTPGQKLSLRSSSAGTQATLASSRPIIADYLDIKDILMSAAKGFAGAHSTNGGNNTGWFFRPPPQMLRVGGKVLPL